MFAEAVTRWGTSAGRKVQNHSRLPLPAQSQAGRGTRDACMILLSFVICKTSAPLSGELGKEGSARWGP